MQPGFYPAGPRDPLGKAFAGSLATHAILVAVLVSGLWNLTNKTFGSPQVSTGSVGVTMVKAIPLPRREGPVNPLASDTNSVVPQAPAPVKLQRQVKEEPEKAIAIPDRVEKLRKPSPRPQIQTLFRPPVPYKSNQVYSTVPQAAVSPMYGMKGSAGIDIGQDSVLGTRFGAYADLIRDLVSQHWNRSSIHSLPSQKCAVSFTIARNGTVTNVQVAQPSGNYLLDTSATRAVLDSNPLPALPREFDRNDVTVKLWFQLTQ